MKGGVVNVNEIEVGVTRLLEGETGGGGRKFIVASFTSFKSKTR
jgi:hypothetical protein